MLRTLSSTSKRHVRKIVSSGENNGSTTAPRMDEPPEESLPGRFIRPEERSIGDVLNKGQKNSLTRPSTASVGE
ncbi:hypothetical protein SLS53_006392 [Cytospora paraplurivora]|uniref:Uncharacterized protein n=1 Tax=Cytospora paraplurivora TaxID=2898453 RepID=A0AAN9YE26_9PEZI